MLKRIRDFIELHRLHIDATLVKTYADLSDIPGGPDSLIEKVIWYFMFGEAYEDKTALWVLFLSGSISSGTIQVYGVDNVNV